MDSEQFKDYVKSDVNNIIKILENIGCHKIWQSGKEIRCAAPEGSNPTAVSVNIDSLYSRYFSEIDSVRGDIFVLVQHFRDEDFKESFRFMRALLGVGGSYKSKTFIDPLSVFKSIRRETKMVSDIREREIPKFGQEALSEFVMLPHINLFYEGIIPSTANHFKVCYDPKLDRILFPHFAYDDINSVVGISGRTLRNKEEIKEFMIPKYFNYIKGYMKTWNLYGFSHSIEHVVANNMIIIFEAEKSVLKHHTIHKNKGYSVSVGQHLISDEQVQIIMQNTPSDVEVVIAFDKDVMVGKDADGNEIGEKYLREQAMKFGKYRKASYIFDKYNLLGENDSPIDKGYKVFNYLLEFRKQV